MPSAKSQIYRRAVGLRVKLREAPRLVGDDVAVKPGPNAQKAE
jgi:hypothetical protein